MTAQDVTSRTRRPDLSTDFQRRIWPVLDVRARLDAAARTAAGSTRRGSAA